MLYINQIWNEYFKNRHPIHRNQLIEHYFTFAKQIACKVASELPHYIKLEDVISSAATGLMQAIERFNPSKNVRFETYASIVIRGAIMDELRKLDWIPRSIHEKANLLEKKKEELRSHLGQEPSQEQLAEALNLSMKQFYDLAADVVPASFVYLNDTDKKEDKDTLIADKIPDQKSMVHIDTLDNKELILNSIRILPEKEQLVLNYYYFEDIPFKQIGRRLGISESRVSQLHTAALSKLKKILHFLDL